MQWLDIVVAWTAKLLPRDVSHRATKTTRIPRPSWKSDQGVFR